MEEEEDTSYYSVLNLPRTATSDDVKKAYRSLATVFHPDKHTDPELKLHAEASFSKLQEAYEVLSDPNKRLVYDVYGKQGLSAGLEVGDKLKSREELKEEWEKFQKKREEERTGARYGHRGYYCCRIDARELARLHTPRYPLIKSIIVHNTLYGPGLDEDSFYVQGSASLRQAQAGVGSIIGGYKREFSLHDSLELSVVSGLQTMLTLTSTRQLTPYDQASLAATFNASDGLGLQLSTTRQLLPSTHGSFNWTLGPAASAGMSTSITYRRSKMAITGKLEIGMMNAISLRFSYVVGPKTSLRMVGRVGTSGVDIELGATRRLSQQSTGSMSVVVGLQGVWLKPHYKRDGHTFEFPIWLTDDYRDWKVVVGAHLLPPLVGFLTVRYVVRPVAALRRRRKEEAARRAQLEGIRGALVGALAEQRLLEGPAARRATAEAERGGIVVLTAAYGVLEGHGEAWGGRPVGVIREEMWAQSREQGGEVRPWLEVGVPLQYMALAGVLEIGADIVKMGLMGFADVAPTAEKELYVGYWKGGVVYEVTVGDGEALVLPEKGRVVEDQERLGWLRAEAERLGLGGPA